MRRTLLLLLALLLAAPACGMPQDDPEGTTERVRGGVLRAGLVEHPPWVVDADGDPHGVEVRIIEAFADELDAEVEWHAGTEAEVLGALELRELDVVAGGLLAVSPWAAHVALTTPYVTSNLMVGFPDGEGVPDALDGIPVAAVEGTEALGLLRRTQAEVVVVERHEDLRSRAAASDDFELAGLGLQRTSHVLDEVHHVLAVPQGENQFLVALERLLHDLDLDTIEQWLAEELG